jgi:hypothetical protein
MYTIIQMAKLNALNPEVYVRGTLAKIAEGHPSSRIDELMPGSAGGGDHTFSCLCRHG